MGWSWWHPQLTRCVANCNALYKINRTINRTSNCMLYDTIERSCQIILIDPCILCCARLMLLIIIEFGEQYLQYTNTQTNLLAMTFNCRSELFMMVITTDALSKRRERPLPLPSSGINEDSPGDFYAQGND